MAIDLDQQRRDYDNEYRIRFANIHLRYPAFSTPVHCLALRLQYTRHRFLKLVTMSSKHVTRFRRWFLSSPPAEWTINQLRELTIGALRQGPIPQHVAFEMDGNRRYARNQRIETVEGHYLGFEAMARVCLPTPNPLQPLRPLRQSLTTSPRSSRCATSPVSKW